MRELCAHADPAMAREWVTELDHDLQDADHLVEARSLGHTLIRWKKESTAWHEAQVSNGPTEDAPIRPESAHFVSARCGHG